MALDVTGFLKYAAAQPFAIPGMVVSEATEHIHTYP